MTIKQKAKAYDEALERAKVAYKDEDRHLKATLERIFPQLKESEDELTWLTKYIEEEAYYLSIDIRDDEDRIKLKKLQKAFAWLKKQGEQKPTDKIQLGKKYKCIASPRYSTFMIGQIYKPEDKFLCSLMNFCSDCFKPIEDGEQKVEPKFHEGDWIVNNDSGVIQHIKEIVNVNDETLYVFDEDSVVVFKNKEK